MRKETLLRTGLALVTLAAVTVLTSVSCVAWLGDADAKNIMAVPTMSVAVILLAALTADSWLVKRAGREINWFVLFLLLAFGVLNGVAVAMHVHDAPLLACAAIYVYPLLILAAAFGADAWRRRQERLRRPNHEASKEIVAATGSVSGPGFDPKALTTDYAAEIAELEENNEVKSC